MSVFIRRPGKENKSAKVKKKHRAARWLHNKIPKGLLLRWDKLLAKSFQHRTLSRQGDKEALKEFQIGQIDIAFKGMIFFVCTLAALLFYNNFFTQISYERNPFGEGDKEINLELDDEGEKREISLSLDEQSLTSAQEDEIFRQFFKRLKKELLGKNTSLGSVDKALNFVDCVDGYPFSVSYTPSDLSLISLNGELAEDALALSQGESRTTSVLVEAVYREYSHEEKIAITLVPQAQSRITLFDKFEKMIEEKEASSRQKESFTLSDTWQGLKIKDLSHKNLWKIPVFCLVILLLLLIRSHTSLGEQDKVRHRENMEDFPLIVHLLTLYMGAGLSFPSAVDRICVDYENTGSFTGKRYAFEQIRMMNRCLHMGMRPHEVCLEWGNNFQEKIYAKFAMLLSQGFSKGSKEIRSMMEKEQHDAFQIQVDYVRREGEEASTKLLFPMIVLLMIIMVLVMFPAIMEFYTF